MPASREVIDKVKSIIVKTLELENLPNSIADDASLFGPSFVGGLELDSLAAVDIVLALNRDFDLNIDEIPREAFESIQSLAEFVGSSIGDA